MNLISNLTTVVLICCFVWIGTDTATNNPSDARSEVGPTTTESSSKAPLNSSSENPSSVQNPAKSNKDIEAILQQTVNWDFEEVVVQEVFEEIKEKFNVNVFLDQSARDDSLSEDSLITFRLKDVRIATALRLMLGEHNATYLIQDGVLKIISMDVATDPENFRRTVFDCRDLLQKIAASDERIGKPVIVRILPVHGGSGIGGGGTSGGGASGGGVFNVQLGGGGFGGGNSGKPIERELLKHGQIEQVVGMQEVLEKSDASSSNDGADQAQDARNVVIKTPTADGMLIELIKNMISPDGWEDTNGDGSLMVLGGMLFVAQQEDVLDEIGQFLDEMRNSIR